MSLIHYLDQYKKNEKKILPLEGLWANGIGKEDVINALVFNNRNRKNGAYFRLPNDPSPSANTKEWYDEIFSAKQLTDYNTIIIKANVDTFSVNCDGKPRCYTYSNELSLQVPLNNSQILTVSKDGFEDFTLPSILFSSIKIPPPVYKAVLKKKSNR